MVRVIAKDGTVLQPTNRHGKVRRLLRDGKAKVISKEPFTIQLLYKTKSKKTQPIRVYFDTGSKYQGFALVSNNKVISKGTIELRDGISELISQRRRYRRSRRHRNKRYRSPHSDNCQYGKGWLPPSIESKYQHITHWINKITSCLPDYHLIVEIAKFDIQAMDTPGIEGEDYQHGNLYGYENTKQYVIHREKSRCQLCGNPKGDDKWNLHHRKAKKDGGSDRAKNLALLHGSCHTKFHNEDLSDGDLTSLEGKSQRFKDATFMNIIKNRLQRELKAYYDKQVHFTYGFITNINRRMLGLEKTHYNDALAMHGLPVINKVKPLYIKQVRKKKRSLHEAIPRAGRGDKVNHEQVRRAKNSKSITKKGKLWSLWDKVYIPKLKTTGFISGFTGKWVYLQDIDGKYLKLPGKSYKQMNPDQLKLVGRNNNWICKIAG